MAAEVEEPTSLDELAEFEDDAVEGTIQDTVHPHAHAAIRRIETRSGPLPDAEELARYREIDESLPREILEMAKAEQAHRHEINRSEMQLVKDEMSGRFRQVRTGQWLGFGIAGLVLALAAVMALTGHEVLAGIMAGVDVIGLAAVFVGTKMVQRSSPDKDEEQPTEDEE